MAKTNQKDAKQVMTKEQSTALAAMQASELPTGFEGADAKSYATPFLRIIQANSPQLMEDSEIYNEKAKPGHFINSVTNEVYGKTIEVIAFKFDRSYLEWKPDRGGFVGMHSIAEGERLSQDLNGMGDRVGLDNDNIFQDTHTFYLLIAGREMEGPIIFPLSSTGIKHSRKWMSAAKMLRLPNGAPAPLYASTYEMTTLINENDQGRWYQIGNKTQTGITRIDFIDDEQFALVKEAIELFDIKEIEKSFEKDSEY